MPDCEELLLSYWKSINILPVILKECYSVR